MTPSARVQAAIELLDEIIQAAENKGAPADRLISAYFKTRRYAGSKDRRAVRDLVYRAIRLCGEVPYDGRSAMLALATQDAALPGLFDGSAHGPARIEAGEMAAFIGLAPDWLEEQLNTSAVTGQEAQALLGRAPLDLRINTLKTAPDALELPQLGEVLPLATAMRFPSGTAVEQWPAYRNGEIEIQDLGSQYVCEALPAKPGDVVLDLCAGAGGKTLALAARFDNQLRLIASDTDKRRLGNLKPRAERAGALIEDIVLLDPRRELEGLAQWQGQCDHVLVDAPCSGTGTWRRNPESRWRLDRKELERLTALQDHVLDVAAQMVKPGGSITFVTCSLLDAEGASRIAEFLKRHQDWRAQPCALAVGSARGEGTRLSPYHDGTDGFFVANLALN